METFSNLDLLSVGIAVSGMILIGAAIFFNDRKSVTNRSFFYFTFLAAIWSSVNYLYYQLKNPDISFVFLKFVMFFSVWFVFFLFRMLYAFPSSSVTFPKWYKYILIPIVSVVSITTLTPLVFEKITQLDNMGRISQIHNGPGIIVYGITISFLILGGITILFKKTFIDKPVQKKPYAVLGAGITGTFLLIIIFNFILPAFFDNAKFIPLGAIFLLPIVVCTSYSIYRDKLFNVRNAATIFISLALTVTTFLEIIFSTDIYQIIFRGSVFILVLVFSVQLIRNMIKLEQANVRLQELDKLKSEFVSLATHQIRAPLSAIKGYLSEMFEGDFGPINKDLEKPLQVVFQSTENLIHIVGDFLNISRIEQNRMKYETAPFDFKNVVEEVIKESKPNISRAGLDLSFDAPESNYSVNADIGKVKQVVSNLLDNSLKYTPHGSIHISLSTNQANQTVRLAIKDTGIGIDPAVMPKLFQKFTRAEGANEVNIIGTGLGLYVAKLMIEGQNGRIWAESEGTDKGSQFYVELPMGVKVTRLA